MLCRSQISKIKSKPYNITFEKRHVKSIWYNSSQKRYFYTVFLSNTARKRKEAPNSYRIIDFFAFKKH